MTQQMPFGKYKGRSLEELPAEYILWLCTQLWVRGKHRALYREACRFSVPFLKSVVLDLEPVVEEEFLV